MSVEAWRKAKNTTAAAKNYLSLIGKTTDRSTLASREGAGATAGKLTTFSIKTQIHFQPYDGATNYHDCKEFDAALTEVVRKKWESIRDEAIELLEKREAEAAIAAKASVEKMLAEIEEAVGVNHER